MLIDLDETILCFGKREDLLQEVAREFAAEAAPVSFQELAVLVETAFVEFWSDAERHRVSRLQPLEAIRRVILGQLFETLRERAPGLTAAVATTFADRFHDYREGRVACFEGAIDTIDALRARGVKLALVTNGRTEVQRAKINRFDLTHRFDHIQIEEEHGVGKPDERCYRHAMQVLNVRPSDCWMVGDNLEWEVAAPQRLGIYSIWVDAYGRGLPDDSIIKPDRIIRSLSELMP